MQQRRERQSFFDYIDTLVKLGSREDSRIKTRPGLELVDGFDFED